jgi:hypothetical protein
MGGNDVKAILTFCDDHGHNPTNRVIECGGHRTTREQRRQLKKDNAKLTAYLAQIPRDEWPSSAGKQKEVWRSQGFFVQVFDDEGTERLSINRTTIDVATGRWDENISWDEIQRLKAECGRGDKCAVEIYPPDLDVVNVANMRHVWIVPAPEFMWKRR